MVLLCVIAAVHLVAIVANSVNLPFMDEWEALRPGALGPDLDWAWVLRPHNEHRIVFTKLLTWILFKSTGWHHIANLVLNFLIYLVEMAAFVVMLRAINPANKRKPGQVISPGEFFWCLLGLSGLAWENHSWGFQSQFHFFLLFYFIAVAAAVRPDRWFGITGISAVASAFSFSSGVVCAGTVAFFLTIRAMAGMVTWRRALPQITIIVAGLAAWGTGFQKNAGHPEYSWPWTKAFWTHYLSMIGNGWSLPEGLKIPVTAAVLTVITVHFAISLAQLSTRKRLNQAVPLINAGSALAGLLATAALTSLARGGFGVEQANSSRYTEFSFFILPLTWTILTAISGIGLDMTNRIPGRQAAMIKAVFAVMLIIFFAPRFAFTRVYRWHKIEMQKGRDCVARYYDGNLAPDQICSTIYIAPLSQQLERAQELNLAFTAEYRVNRQDNKETRP